MEHMETIITLPGEPTQLTSDQVAAQEAADEIWEQDLERYITTSRTLTLTTA